MNRFETVSGAAQAILENPQDHTTVTAGLEDAMLAAHGRMAETNPVRAEYVVAGGVRAALFAARGHMVQSRLNALMLDELETGRPVVPANLPSNSELLGPYADIAGKYAAFPLPGTSADVLDRTVSYWDKQAIDSLAVEPADHPYQALTRAAEPAQERYRQADARLFGNDFDYAELPVVDYALRSDNSNLTLRALVCAGLAAGRRDADGLARFAAAHVRQLADAASVPGNVITDVLPKDAGLVFSQHEWGMDRAVQLREYSTAFEPDGWTHASLKRGRRSNPLCVGLVALRTMDSRDRAVEARLFAMVKERAGSPVPTRPDGAYDRVTAMLATVGIPAAAETIYANWPALD